MEGPEATRALRSVDLARKIHVKIEIEKPNEFNFWTNLILAVWPFECVFFRNPMVEPMNKMKKIKR